MLNKLRFFLLFVKFRCKSSFYRRFSQSTYFEEKIAGYTVGFADYDAFLYSFKEIFIWQIYAFNTTKPAPLIIDAGSNIGLSVIYFKLCYPQAQLLAFEPDPQNLAFLLQNMSVNHLDDVKVLPLALSHQEGTQRFTRMSNSRQNLQGSLMALRKGEEEIQVNTATLSSFITQEVDLLKMDIEGAEKVVIAELIQHQKMEMIAQIIVEYHDVITDNAPEEYQHFVDLFANNKHHCRVLLHGETDELNNTRDILLHTQKIHVQHG
jgi:FkbM family methyltransferase